MTAHHSSVSRAIVRLIRHPPWWQVSSSFRCPLYSSPCPQGTDIFSRFRLVFPAEQYSRFIHLQNYLATFIFLILLLSKSLSGPTSSQALVLLQGSGLRHVSCVTTMLGQDGAYGSAQGGTMPCAAHRTRGWCTRDAAPACVGQRDCGDGQVAA